MSDNRKWKVKFAANAGKDSGKTVICTTQEMNAHLSNNKGNVFEVVEVKDEQ